MGQYYNIKYGRMKMPKNKILEERYEENYILDQEKHKEKPALQGILPQL